MFAKRAGAVLAIGLAAGMLIMMAGLLWLYGMISVERDEAAANLYARQRSTVDYAELRFKDELAKTLDNAKARIARSLRDPLVSCDDCLYTKAEHQYLPARSGRHPRDASPAGWQTALQQLQRGIADTGNAIWDQRIALQRKCKRHRHVANEILAFQSQYALLAHEDIASHIALLENCDPPRPIIAGLLRDRISVPDGRPLPGLQPLVLHYLRAPNATDIEALRTRVIALSRRLGVGYARFVDATQSMVTQPVPLPKLAPGRYLVRDLANHKPGQPDYWLVERGAAETHGVKVILAQRLKALTEYMQARQLGPRGDIAAKLAVDTPAIPLDDIKIIVTDPDHDDAQATLRDRFTIKLLALAGSGAMAVIIALLAFMLFQRRRKLLALKARFVAGVSHELRTPLASMRLLAETIADRTKDTPSVKDYPERLVRDIDGMNLLVDNILSFNQLVNGRWRLDREPVQLGPMIERLANVARETSARDCVIATNVGRVAVDGDRDLLTILFSNLITNAITHGQRDPTVIDICQQPTRGAGIEILIRDNGIGIAKADRNRIFEEFYRGRNPGDSRGSGLGLALCRRIMKLHGGSITLRSTGPTGTTFGVAFP